ncbi:MAG: nitroreductase family protein [Eubacteriales bacterium]|nr:nitroreductase family protein [Eubacteriales bacterium]MDD4513431.1 nitroreductase family protein [Eubacteriales bacterium]
MEFYEVINKRRSIRQFEDKPISKETLERVLDAGLKAPSSNHQRQWELLTLTDKALIHDLAQLVRPYPCRITEPKTPQQEMFKIAYPRQRSMIEESACVILPYFKMKYDLKDSKNDYGLMDYGAAWALVENILLAATAEGLGSVVHIPVKTEPVKIKEFMQVPDGYYLPTLIMLGYASPDALTPAQVPATVEKKVRWNKW